MRQRLLVIPVVLLAALGAARAEEPAKTYDLHTWREVWKAGDTASVKGEDGFTGRIEQSWKDPKTEKQEMHTSLPTTRDAYAFVVRCLEADAQGRPTRSLVYVSAWTHTERDDADPKTREPKTDTSAQGLHLEVIPTETAHAFRILTPDAKPSPTAGRWLQQQFGSDAKARGRPDLDQLGRPQGPVKVGDAWKGDPKMLEFPFPIDAKASSANLALTQVSAGRARISEEIRMKVTGYPLGPSAPVAPVTEGGEQVTTGWVERSLDPGTFDFEVRLSGGLKLTAALESFRITLETSFTSAVVGTTGGEMPKPPGEKPAEPATAPK